MAKLQLAYDSHRLTKSPEDISKKFVENTISHIAVSIEKQCEEGYFTYTTGLCQMKYADAVSITKILKQHGYSVTRMQEDVSTPDGKLYKFAISWA